MITGMDMEWQSQALLELQQIITSDMLELILTVY